MPRDTKPGGYAKPSTEKGTTPNIKPTRYSGVPQKNGPGRYIEPTNETMEIRNGELDTNRNIGCGYGTVTGKGNKGP